MAQQVNHGPEIVAGYLVELIGDNKMAGESFHDFLDIVIEAALVVGHRRGIARARITNENESITVAAEILRELEITLNGNDLPQLREDFTFGTMQGQTLPMTRTRRK